MASLCQASLCQDSLVLDLKVEPCVSQQWHANAIASAAALADVRNSADSAAGVARAASLSAWVRSERSPQGAPTRQRSQQPSEHEDLDRPHPSSKLVLAGVGRRPMAQHLHDLILLSSAVCVGSP